MNDYDEEALVARSRCNHTLGRNEEAIEDGKLLKIEDGKGFSNDRGKGKGWNILLQSWLAARAGLAKNRESISATEALGKVGISYKYSLFHILSSEWTDVGKVLLSDSIFSLFLAPSAALVFIMVY